MSDLPTAADRCQGCNEPIGKRHVSGCVYDVTTADSEREDELIDLARQSRLGYMTDKEVAVEIDAYLDRRLDAAVSGLPEKQDPVHEALKFDTGYKMGWNEALDAAKQSILSQKSGNGSGKAGGEV